MSHKMTKVTFLFLLSPSNYARFVSIELTLLYCQLKYQKRSITFSHFHLSAPHQQNWMGMCSIIHNFYTYSYIHIMYTQIGFHNLWPILVYPLCLSSQFYMCFIIMKRVIERASCTPAIQYNQADWLTTMCILEKSTWHPHYHHHHHQSW